MIHRGLVRSLRTCAEELDALDADWAVAGATALAIHGFERATKDVDLFIADDVRERLLERLSDRGLAVEEVFPPMHYSVAPPRARDPDVRVDLLFPALGVESLGLMAARPAAIAGRQMPVVPLAHLVAAKLAVDPAEDRARHDKDLQDLRELRVRGLIDVERVRELLTDTGDRGAIERLSALMRRV